MLNICLPLCTSPLEKDRQCKGPFRKDYSGGGGFSIFAGEIWVPPFRGLAKSGYPPYLFNNPFIWVRWPYLSKFRSFDSKCQWVFGWENSLKWVLMVEPLTLNVFIKVKHHVVKINLQSPTECYQPITFAICCRTRSRRKQQLSLKVWSIELAKTFNNVA